MTIFKTIVTTATFLALVTSVNTAFSLNIKEVTKVIDFGGNLNVRYGPGKRKIDSIKSGTSGIKVLKTVGRGRNQWSRIKWSGKIGWVSSKYLVKVASVDITKNYQVTASTLNVRKGAGRNNAVTGAIKRGTSDVKILKVEKVGKTYWANIAQGSKKGWVSADYLKVATTSNTNTGSTNTGSTNVGGSTSTGNTHSTGLQFYTVTTGDTLYGIQRKTGKNWKVVAALNNIQAPYELSLGQKLRIR